MRTYDKEFKINAVKLQQSSGRSISSIARELGIGVSTLSKWVSLYNSDSENIFPGKGHVTAHEEELRVLRKELQHVRQERDILKKAVVIFSDPQGKGTVL